MGSLLSIIDWGNLEKSFYQYWLSSRPVSTFDLLATWHKTVDILQGD